ncbi:hypothetical protein A6M21_11365 [Desulfotomaculum copahuensis]|uniref:Uncharacterized protein n=1 Tax=Desulfotomaculum copahuensis TaxID=1838280 RepID=A0A1B7LDP5_9FIRM|nr:hypothetical protein A6M21_11365 [Desulfotomaculum copahuensis]
MLRNSLFNFIGQAVPILAGIFCMPGIVHLLGPDRFGVLSLAWMLINYFTLFDFGLGRAVTKFIADCLERKERFRLSSIIWTALSGQLLLSLVAALILFELVPVLVLRVFQIPPLLHAEARHTFIALACSLPPVLLSNGLRSILGGGQRFDLINLVALPVSTLYFVIPLVALSAGLTLPVVVALLGATGAASALVYLFFCLKIFPETRRPVISRQTLKYLLSFGGWVTVSNIISPVLVYLDRFLIGALLSVAAVAYYTAPYEVVTRLWIFPVSLVNCLFPAFSAMSAGESRSVMSDMYGRSMKFLLLIVGPVVFVTMLFARDILLLWLGADYAARSTLVFQILAVGVLINSLAQIPFALVQGAGRPDVSAKFHLIELPLYVGLLWFVLHRSGIEGAAVAWTMRVTLDAVLLMIASGRLFACRVDGRVFFKLGGAVLLLIALAFYAGGAGVFIWQLTAVVGGLAAFLAAGWMLALDEGERAWLSSIFRSKRTLEGLNEHQ